MGVLWDLVEKLKWVFDLGETGIAQSLNLLSLNTD